MTPDRNALTGPVVPNLIQTAAMDQKLVGIHEIAAALGVTRQRADQLSRREDFPKPVVELQMGRIWNTKDIEKWMERHGR